MRNIGFTAHIREHRREYTAITDPPNAEKFKYFNSHYGHRTSVMITYVMSTAMPLALPLLNFPDKFR